MLIKSEESKKYGCVHPVMEDGKPTILACQGRLCMAFREFGEHKGYCGLASRPLEVEKSIMGVVAEEMQATLGMKKKKRTVTVPVEFPVGDGHE